MSAFKLARRPSADTSWATGADPDEYRRRDLAYALLCWRATGRRRRRSGRYFADTKLDDSATRR